MLKGAVAAVFFSFGLTAEAQAADPAFDRTVDAALASPLLPTDVIERARGACDTALCFAEALASARPDNVRLEPVSHPDTDSIRWAKTSPSLTAHETDGILKLKITHFGRKAATELREASATSSQPVTIDLRGNAGGDFERMLEIAGLLLGSRPDVIEIDHGDRIERRALKGLADHRWRILRVETDENTTSAALLLARLIEDSGAERIGPIRDDPVFLKRRITIDHDWRLILPVAEVRVAGSG